MSDQGQAQRDTLAEALRALLAVLDADDDPRWDGENEYSRAHAALAAVAEAAEADRDRLQELLQEVEHPFDASEFKALLADRDKWKKLYRDAVQNWPTDTKVVELMEDLSAAEADRDRLTADRADAIIGENMALQAVEHHKRRANAAEADRDRLAAALRENVGDAYNLLTQGESPTQRRGPSAQRIYDRSRAALAEVAGDDA